jgi:hypothetical protein
MEIVSPILLEGSLIHSRRQKSIKYKATRNETREPRTENLPATMIR